VTRDVDAAHEAGRASCSDAPGFITGAELAVDGDWGVKPVL
jgi:hypothetical protein